MAIPSHILKHAPLLHLATHDPYRPSSLTTHLSHTKPHKNLAPIPASALPSSPLTLDNLAVLNGVDGDGDGDSGGRAVYLTSEDDVSGTPAPRWLCGVRVGGDGGDDNGNNNDDGLDEDERKTGVIIIVDKGKGVQDVFYFYFFSFNFGGVVLGRVLGDHVGDWEHNMIRFEKGVPKTVWLSQHSNGEAYAFSCLQKDSSGQRPIIYVANGSHALYPTPGTHDHTIPNLNLSIPLILVDECDTGIVYDPANTSYIYSYTITPTPTFTPLTPDTPTSFLLFTGRWGDAEYPESDKRQHGNSLLGFRKYVGGPTGPADKQLDRKEVWPENQWSAGQRVRSRLPGTWWWDRMVERVKRMAKGRFGKKSARKGWKRLKISGEVIG